LYSFVRDLPEDGHADPETCRRHIVKWQNDFRWFFNCWIKCCVILPLFRKSVLKLSTDFKHHVFKTDKYEFNLKYR
jgi:hypothetical protein